MKIKMMGLILMVFPVVFAEDARQIDVEMSEDYTEEAAFVVTVTPDQGRVIEELVTTMGNTSVFTLAFKKPYLRKLAKNLRPVSSTQFLGYVFERPNLIKCMKKISKSSIKWNGLTRSIVRGLKKEAVNNLFSDIPMFADHTGGDHAMLSRLAKLEDWNGFILHLVDQN